MTQSSLPISGYRILHVHLAYLSHIGHVEGGGDKMGDRVEKILDVYLGALELVDATDDALVELHIVAIRPGYLLSLVDLSNEYLGVFLYMCD